MNLPVKLELQLHTKCNLNCKYCYNYFDSPSQKFDFYKKYLDIFINVKASKFCIINGGEPFLTKDMWKIINYFPHDVDILTFTNANLKLCNYIDIVNNIDEYKLNNIKLNISIHFEEIDIELFISNCQYLSSKFKDIAFNLILSNELFEKLEKLEKILNNTNINQLNLTIEDSLYEDMELLNNTLKNPLIKDLLKLLINIKYVNFQRTNNCKTFKTLLNMIRINSQHLLPKQISHEIIILLKNDDYLIESTIKDLDIFNIDNAIKNNNYYIEDLKSLGEYL